MQDLINVFRVGKFALDVQLFDLYVKRIIEIAKKRSDILLHQLRPFLDNHINIFLDHILKLWPSGHKTDQRGRQSPRVLPYHIQVGGHVKQLHYDPGGT